MARTPRRARTASVSASSDLADEPALAWRGDLPGRAPGPRARWATTPAWRKWLACLGATVAAAPFAVAAAFYQNTTAGVGALVLVVVVGPLIEESVKGAPAVYLAEFRPWLVPAGWALVAVTLTAGLGFAVLENLWYLEVLIDDPSDRIVRIRWIAGPIVHGTGSLLVGLGVARMWRRAIVDDRGPVFADVQNWIIAAAVWHGAYNAAAVVLEITGSLSVAAA